MAQANERYSPQNDLQAIKRRVSNHGINLTKRVEKHLFRKEITREEVKECIQSLGEEEFHKSQEHKRLDGVWLDIYKPVCHGIERYLKLFIGHDGKVMVYSYWRA